MSSAVYLALFCLVLAIWAVLKNTFSAAAQPLRLELAERGEAILRDLEMPVAFRRRIAFMLDHAFGMRGVLLAAIIGMIPLSLAFLVNPNWFAVPTCERCRSTNSGGRNSRR